ncbi:hypothetical protein U1872_18395 [Sphingomonas sp. RB3P16]|uniref:hypothetical protein n=1 Tax=Parasphingomonas frigoris TaxID=3096163 RepID=UPI002FC7DD2D
MFLADPRLILVAFFMARLMIHLALNALPVAAAVAAFFVVRAADGTLVQSLLAAGGEALAITAFGHVAIRHLTTHLRVAWCCSLLSVQRRWSGTIPYGPYRHRSGAWHAAS